MKAVFINEYGDADKLVYGDLEKPIPGKDQVLIRIKAASVNPVDWKVREGRLKFLSGKDFPIIMGTELAGEIEMLGAGVKTFNPGDRVFAGLSHRGGAYAEYVAVSSKKVVLIPDALAFQKACTLAVAGMTPLQAFTYHYKVRPGDEVLVNGAAGGVGMYAVQIAKILGARVTGVCSDTNREFVSGLGADEIIDYNKEDFRHCKEAFDVVLDAAANAFFPEARQCLKKGGMLIKLNLSVRSVFLQYWTKLFSQKKLKMILVKNRPEDLNWLAAKILEGKIHIEIEQEYPLNEARAAQERSQSGRTRGKLVIRTD